MGPLGRCPAPGGGWPRWAPLRRRQVLGQPGFLALRGQPGGRRWVRWAAAPLRVGVAPLGTAAPPPGPGAAGVPGAPLHLECRVGAWSPGPQPRRSLPQGVPGLPGSGAPLGVAASAGRVRMGVVRLLCWPGTPGLPAGGWGPGTPPPCSHPVPSPRACPACLVLELIRGCCIR